MIYQKRAVGEGGGCKRAVGGFPGFFFFFLSWPSPEKQSDNETEPDWLALGQHFCWEQEVGFSWGELGSCPGPLGMAISSDG